MVDYAGSRWGSRQLEVALASNEMLALGLNLIRLPDGKHPGQCAMTLDSQMADRILVR